MKHLAIDLQTGKRESWRLRAWAAVLAIAIHGAGFLDGYFIWRWAEGRQSNSFPVYFAILSPVLAATFLASWVASRMTRS